MFVDYKSLAVAFRLDVKKIFNDHGISLDRNIDYPNQTNECEVDDGCTYYVIYSDDGSVQYMQDILIDNYRYNLSVKFDKNDALEEYNEIYEKLYDEE